MRFNNNRRNLHNVFIERPKKYITFLIVLEEICPGIKKLLRYIQRSPDELIHINMLINSFIKRPASWNYYCLCSVKVLQKFHCPRTKNFCLASFFEKKKVDAEVDVVDNFRINKQILIPLSLKVTSLCFFSFLLSMCILCNFSPNFTALQ